MYLGFFPMGFPVQGSLMVNQEIGGLIIPFSYVSWFFPMGFPVQGFLMVNQGICAVGTTFLKTGSDVMVVRNLGATGPPGHPAYRLSLYRLRVSYGTKVSKTTA